MSRDLGVTAARLSEWREAALQGAGSALKGRPADNEAEDQVRQLKSLVGDLTMRLEISRQAVLDAKEGRDPFVLKRSRR